MFAQGGPGGDDPRTPKGNTKEPSSMPGAPRKRNSRKIIQGRNNDDSLEQALDAIDEMGGPGGLPPGFGDIKSAFEGQSRGRGLYSANPGNFNPSSMGFGLSPESGMRQVQSAPDLASMDYTTPPQSPSGSPKGAPDAPYKKKLANPRTKGGKSKRSKKSKLSKKNKISKKSRKSKKSKAKKSRKSRKSKKSKKHH